MDRVRGSVFAFAFACVPAFGLLAAGPFAGRGFEFEAARVEDFASASDHASGEGGTSFVPAYSETWEEEDAG